MISETPKRSSYELPKELTLSSLRRVCRGSEQLTEMYDDLEDCVYRYYEVAVQFEYFVLASKDDFFSEAKRSRLETFDELRRRTHTSLCDKLRILARLLVQENHGIDWILLISGSSETDNRESIGRWAIRQITEKTKQEISHVPVYGDIVAGVATQGLQTDHNADSCGV